MRVLLERDIEDALYNHPRLFPMVDHTFRLNRWLARQYSVPSGIIDLLGLLDNDLVPEKSIAVVELKRGRIDAQAIAQVCRYAGDIEAIQNVIANRYGAMTIWNKVVKVIVGQSVDHKTLLSASALNIQLLKYDSVPSVAVVGQWLVSGEMYRERDSRHTQLADDSPFEAWVAEAKEIGATWGKKW